MATSTKHWNGAAEASVAGHGYTQRLKPGGRRGLAFRLVCCFLPAFISRVSGCAYSTGFVCLDTEPHSAYLPPCSPSPDSVGSTETASTSDAHSSASSDGL